MSVSVAIRALPTEQEIRSVVAAVLAGLTVETRSAPALTAEPLRAAAPSAELAVGADHGGYRLKERIVAALREDGHEVRDCGTHGTEAVDYPDFAHAVARLVAERECDVGIVVDGAGIGSCMAANKVPGIRAATCWDVSSARNSREHNHANVLALGAGLIGENLALEIVRAWLETPWGGDRHARRVGLIGEIERRYVAGAEVGATR
ncbi:MAG: ribose 5-phosphate isomerase B [Gaiella sp.]|nr:ribose 5-phosphate isomerase B [Gaiella sp.]